MFMIEIKSFYNSINVITITIIILIFTLHIYSCPEIINLNYIQNYNNDFIKFGIYIGNIH